MKKYSAGCYECSFNKLFGQGLQKIFKQKPYSSYPKGVKEAVSLVSVSPKNSLIFGSYIFKEQKYPGDIDAIEIVRECCGIDEALKKIAKKIQTLILHIINQDGTYFIEFKAGLDPIFQLYVGKFYKGQLVGYNPIVIKEELKILHDNELLDDLEYKFISELVKPNITENEHMLLESLLREKYIVRWYANDIKQGFKKLVGNRRIYLDEAIAFKSNIILDIWTQIQGRYKEVSNIFILVSKDKEGKEQLINYEYNPEYDIEFNVKTYVNNSETLRKDIKKLYSDLYYNPYKMAKRMWSLSRKIDDTKVSKELIGLFQSDVAIMNQVNGEIKLMIAMITKLSSPPMKIILSQIDDLRGKLAYINNIEFDEEGIDNMINYIVEGKPIKETDMFTKDQLNKTPTRKDIVEHLEHISKYLKKIIFNETEKYLKKLKLYPPPQKYL